MDKKIPCRQGTAADIIKSLGITEEELERAKKLVEKLTGKQKWQGNQADK